MINIEKTTISFVAKTELAHWLNKQASEKEISVSKLINMMLEAVKETINETIIEEEK